MPIGDFARLAFRLEDLRVFRDTGVIEVPPITLVLGKNSSGKTTILRGLALIRQLVLARTESEAALAGPEVDFGAFSDAVRDGVRSRDIRVSVEIDTSKLNKRFHRLDSITSEMEPFFERVLVETTLHWNKTSGRAEFQRVVLRANGANGAITFSRRGPGEFVVDAPTLGVHSLRSQPLSMASLRFMRLRREAPTKRAIGDAEEALEYLVYVIWASLEDAVRSVYHIGPLREMPDRYYRLDQAGRDLGLPSVVEILSARGRALADVGVALEQMEMARSISVVKQGPGLVSLELSELATGRHVNIADVGFGVSQALPILVRVLSAPRGSTFLIEQPELHLHPSAQAELADVLYRAAKTRGVSLLMETHSEHFLLRLQRRVADTSLTPNEIAVYFVDEGQVRRAAMDDAGRLDLNAMPRGFFDDDWLDVVETMNQRAIHGGS